MGTFILSGCMSFSAHSGTPIEQEQLEKLRPGKTTKYEIFERIGPPMSVASRNELISIPAPFQRIQKIASIPQSSEAWFELFSSVRNLNEYHRVYYFYYAKSKKKSAFGFTDSTETDFDKLWLLVNEQTGIVEDYKVIKKIPYEMNTLLKILCGGFCYYNY